MRRRKHQRLDDDKGNYVYNYNNHFDDDFEGDDNDNDLDEAHHYFYQHKQGDYHDKYFKIYHFDHFSRPCCHWLREDVRPEVHPKRLYLHFANTSEIDTSFADIAATGATTVRTWGFNEVTAASGIYYQLWSGSTATVNTGADGLARFDQVVASAKSHGLKLIVALTNNWADYGGMDVYVKQILGSTNHDLFYTDATVIAAFKSYIQTFVTRYKNEPTILAWELANEPRCTGSTGASTGTCTTATITAWIKNISAYIKSIDANHLVSIGDEGFGLPTYGTEYVYTTGPGLDFAANLAISTIDFGTFHLYPGSWGASGDYGTWGNTWINAHAAVQKSLNKPVILEEFGVTTNQTAVYNTWWSTVVSSGLAGDLIWQAGSVLPSNWNFNDGYQVFPGDSNYIAQTAHAAALKARG